MKKLSHIQGFSLLETVLYVAIFLMIITALTSFSSTLNSSRLKNQMYLEVADQGSRILRHMTRSVQNARKIITPTISNSGSMLSVVSADSATTTYTFSSDTLFIVKNDSNPVALTNNHVQVSNLVFTNYSGTTTPGVVKISFTLSNSTSTMRQEEQYSLDFFGTASIR